MKMNMYVRMKSLVVDNTCVGNETFIPINEWIEVIKLLNSYNF